ncbi:MAG: hypothetical protein NTV63_00120 [Candidatus Woesearchaeota archaeon]|nr:hypothetical protein [Candidatus Woesearchaeota archaeon]
MPENSNTLNSRGILVIRPNLLLALFSGILKLGFFFGLIYGVYELIVFSAGEDPFIVFFEIFSVDVSAVFPFIKYALVLLSLIYLFYITISLNLLKIEFSDEKIIFYSGIIMLSTRYLDYSDVIRTNFKSYNPLKAGSIKMEFTGELQSIEIPYLANSQKKAGLVISRVSESQLKSLSERIYLASKGSVEKEIVDKIISAVRQENFSRQGFVTQIANIAKKQKIGNDVFEVILSYMLKTNKIEKKDIMSVMFELMGQGVISRKDVSEVLFKISGERI